MKKKLYLLCYIILFIVYLELVFSLSTFNHIDLNFIYIILFSWVLGSLFYLFSNLFKATINKILTYLTIIFLDVLFIAQLTYNKIYQSIISIYSIGDGTGQVLQFFNQIIDTLLNNWLIVLMMVFPIIIFIICDIKKCFSYEKVAISKKIILLISAMCLHFSLILSFEFINDSDMYSNKNLYNNVNAPLLTAQKLGILTEMRLDIKRSIFGFKENDVIENNEIVNYEEVELVETEYGYNTLNYDFESINENETNEVYKNMNSYFNSLEPSKKNEYTGMFKDKNLIVFVAEAFSDIAIREDLTPNLYRLYNEGFQFNNFYTPLFPVSTADGEYITDTSLIPKEGVWSIAKINGNYMPYSYANVFENLGYTSNAYHNNTATYYKRGDYIKTMGYDSFKACGKGLDINCKIWPQSDMEMIEKSVDDYINDDKFIAYYMTVSGHLEYTKNGNMMVVRNWNSVKDLSYSHKAKSYIASQMELDKAIGLLIEKLTLANKLDDTVIVISGDHYPYGLNLDEINELSSYERDKDFEIHHMPFLIWNSQMEKSIKIDKYASSLDVLPTVLNLFGVEFDSRLLMGKDILSEGDNIVIFSNRSFITEKGKYNTVNKKFHAFNEEVTDDYIKNISSIIYNKYKYSKLILEHDYYRYLYGKLGIPIKK